MPELEERMTIATAPESRVSVNGVWYSLSASIIPLSEACNAWL